jgi:hypothetical protein
MDTQKKTSRISLTANGSKLTLFAVRRKDDTATSFVVTTDADRKATRGMTEIHTTFEAAAQAIAKRATEAEKLGWRRGVRRSFIAKPDAFTTMPPVPKPAKQGRK